MDRPVIVFEGASEFEAQMVRDTLQSGMIPVLHVPSLSTGLFAQRQTTRVAVPAERADEAISLLRDNGFEAGRQERPKGVAEVNDAVSRALPRSARILLFVVLAGTVILGVLTVWLGNSGK